MYNKIEYYPIGSKAGSRPTSAKPSSRPTSARSPKPETGSKPPSQAGSRPPSAGSKKGSRPTSAASKKDSRPPSASKGINLRLWRAINDSCIQSKENSCTASLLLKVLAIRNWASLVQG